jgi:Tol biopolymer transport system component
VPDLNGAKLADVLAQAKAAGVQVHQSLAISGTVPKGRVVGQVQKTGVTLPPGSTLEITVSLGEPRIAFDNGRDIFTADGYSGGQQRPVATTKDDELEPAFSPNGKLIAYRRGPKGGDTSQIFVVQVDKPDTARPLTNDGFDDRRPAFSPNGQVVAFVRAKPDGTGARVLCFKRLSSPTDVPACKANPDVNVSRPAWTPDGKTIYVQGQKGGTDQPVQIWAYHTSKPDSSKPSDWTVVGAVSAPFEGTSAGGAPPGVNMVRPNPVKPEVAFTANWRTGVYRLWTAPIQPDGSLGTPHAVRGGRLNACEFSWRLDGQEIVYVEADAACQQGGKIERNDVMAPVQATALTKVGFANPAWDPRPPGG